MTNEPETTPEARCVGCGYDLRGLDPAGECPECATSVARSLAGEYLSFADPAWVRGVVRGQQLASFGLILCVVGALAAIVIFSIGSVLTGARGISWGEPVADVLSSILIYIACYGGLIVSCVGFFMVTTLDPRDRERETPTSTRMLARWGMALAVSLLMLGTFDAWQTTAAHAAIAAVIQVLGLGALAVAVPSLLLWLGELARRIPSQDLANKTMELGQTMRKRLTLLLVFVALREVLPLIPPGTTVGRIASIMETIAGCGAGIVMLLLLIGLSSAFENMNRLAGAFKALTIDSDDCRSVRP